MCPYSLLSIDIVGFVVCLFLIVCGILKQWLDYMRKKVKDQVKAAQALALAQGAAPRLKREKRSISKSGDVAHDHSSLWKSTKRGVLMARPARLQPIPTPTPTPIPYPYPYP